MTSKRRMSALLEDIEIRRVDAFSAGNRSDLTVYEHLALIPEATTAADIEVLSEARLMLDPFARRVLDLYSEVWGEFGEYRCSVCGRTPKQSAAIGYDCSSEC